MNEDNTVIDLNLDTTKIPVNDLDAWNMYPKFRWVYETSRLMDIQNINWAPFQQENYETTLPAYNINKITDIKQVPFIAAGMQHTGAIFIERLAGEHLITDVVVQKGCVKWLKHHRFNDKNERVVIDVINGNLELKINAMITLHFQKYIGVLSIETIGQNIIAIRLRMTSEIIDQYPEDWLKKVQRVYNRRPWCKK